jgi:drug/metabolite transporter (DMT)-like permease
MKKYVAILLGAGFLGLVGIFVKLIGDTVPIMTVVFFRLFIGLLTLLVVIPLFDKTVFHIKRKDLKHYALLGFLFAANFSLYVNSVALGPVSNAVLMVSTFPLWLSIISYFFLKEKVTRFMMACFVIAFLGILIINPFSPGYYLGNILALSAGIMYAGMYAYMRYIDKKHHIGVVFWIMLFGTIFFAPVPFIYGLGTVSWNYIWVIAIGVIGNGFAYLLVNYGLERIQAEMASIIHITTEVLVAIIVAIIIVGELLTINVLVGGVLIVLAALLLEKKYNLTRR